MCVHTWTDGDVGWGLFPPQPPFTHTSPAICRLQPLPPGWLPAACPAPTAAPVPCVVLGQVAGWGGSGGGGSDGRDGRVSARGGEVRGDQSCKQGCRGQAGLAESWEPVPHQPRAGARTCTPPGTKGAKTPAHAHLVAGKEARIFSVAKLGASALRHV